MHQVSESRTKWEGSNIQGDKFRVKRVLAKVTESLFASIALAELRSILLSQTSLKNLWSVAVTPLETATDCLVPRRESYPYRPALAMTHRKKLADDQRQIQFG